MRRVSFVLMILAVAGTSSVRGQQPKIGEALRDKARDAVIEERGPARDARREGRQERRDDRQEGREERRDERREARGDRGDDHELLRLALIAALRDGEFGDRQSVREERREGRQESRDDRQEGARHVGMSDKRRAAIGEATTSCYALRYCGASRRGFWRSAVGQRGTSRGSPGKSRRSTRGREERRDERQEARGDRGGDHELLRLALIAALRNGDFGDRQSVREELARVAESRRSTRGARGTSG